MTNEEFVARITALVDEYMRGVARRLSAALAGSTQAGLPALSLPVRAFRPIRLTVAEMARQGMRPRDIAAQLGRSQSTVNALLSSARRKGELPPSPETARRARANGVES